jgi:hypothetical protein
MTKFQIDVATVLELKLGFEAYFVLYCLHTKDSELLLSYTRSCKKIDTQILNDLASSGYLTITTDMEKISYSNLVLTEEGRSLFKSADSVASCMDEYDIFKQNYPTSVKVGRIPRRLHGNKARCIKLFRDIRKEGITTEDLSRCARIYIKEKLASGDHKYIQLLETWLSKRTYEEYLSELETINPSFTDDI